MIKKEEVQKILAAVMHPTIGASLVELGMLRDVKLEGDKVTVTMVLPFPGVPIKEMLATNVRKPLEKEGLKVEIKEAVMNQGELERFLKMEQEKWQG